MQYDFTSYYKFIQFCTQLIVGVQYKRIKQRAGSSAIL